MRFHYLLPSALAPGDNPMKTYGVLKGSAMAYRRDNDQDPHSELLMSVDGVSLRIAIIVR